MILWVWNTKMYMFIVLYQYKQIIFISLFFFQSYIICKEYRDFHLIKTSCCLKRTKPFQRTPNKTKTMKIMKDETIYVMKETNTFNFLQCSHDNLFFFLMNYPLISLSIIFRPLPIDFLPWICLTILSFSIS